MKYLHTLDPRQVDELIRDNNPEPEEEIFFSLILFFVQEYFIIEMFYIFLH